MPIPVVTFPDLTDNKKNVNLDADPFTETISVKVNDEEVAEPTIEYESSNTEYATVDNNGEVTIIGEGATTITAKVAACQTYAAVEASYVLTIISSLLPETKAAAIAEINAAADAAKAEIDAASTYPSADAVKTEYKGKIDIAVGEAKAAIENATTIADVDAQRSQCTLTINTIVAEAKTAIAPINKLEGYREKVIGEIEKARTEAPLPALEEEQKAFLNEIVNDAIAAVRTAETEADIKRAEDKIFFILSMYPAGKIDGVAELLGDMAEPCTGCTAVEVTDGTTTVTLYKPTKVRYIKVPSEE